MCSNRITTWTVLLLFFCGCGSMKDDLLPSGADKRPLGLQGSVGPAVGQLAPDFTVSDTLGNGVTLSKEIPASKAVVLYFTMWCPTCDSHMSNMQSLIIPAHAGVRFYVIDYVSGTVAESRNAQIANGYGSSPFTVLADTTRAVLAAYRGTMGTTVVIDASGVVRMNEDYKNGSRLQGILGALP